MKAIETRYRGYRFRSRLEARWAVFFDRVGMPWGYEVQGFHTSAGPYLPDFEIYPLGRDGGVTIYVEVKPETAAADETAKADALAHELAQWDPFDDGFKYLAIVKGDPFHFLIEPVVDGSLRVPCPRCLVDGKSVGLTYGPDRWRKKAVAEIECWTCDMTTPSGGDNDPQKTVTGLNVVPHKGLLVADEQEYIAAFHKIKKAAEYARAARFEHGARP